jgi:hypothetical protein
MPIYSRARPIDLDSALVAKIPEYKVCAVKVEAVP